MMLANSLQTSLFLVHALLALSFVSAAALRFSEVATVKAPIVHPTRNELGRDMRRTVQVDQTSLDIAMIESKITRMQKTFAEFDRHISTFFDTLKEDLKNANSNGFNRTAKPTPTGYPTLSPASRNFDPLATNNIAVYYGQTPLTTSTNLLDLCSNPSITIINLAFLPTFFGPNGYPATSFGPACDAPQNPVQASEAPGLQNCDQLGKQIVKCQAQGKIILVSLGGYIASSSFPTAASAHTFASTIWNLFGAGTGENPLLRPFGPDVIVDGFDIDNEDHSTAYWTEFTTALRAKYKSREAKSSGKTYYLSSTPQCPRPDASIPLDVMRMSDFVNVQFYNNPACNLNTGMAFLDSFEAWSADLAGSKAATRLFIAAPAWPGAGSGYVLGHRLERLVKRAKKRAAEYGNFGGIAMWDGVEGLANVNGRGKNYVDFAAEALA